MPQLGHTHIMAGWAKCALALLIAIDVRLYQLCFRAADLGYIGLVDTTLSSCSVSALLLGVDLRLCLLYVRFANIAGAAVPEGVCSTDRCWYTRLADILSLCGSRGCTALVDTVVAS